MHIAQSMKLSTKRRPENAVRGEAEERMRRAKENFTRSILSGSPAEIDRAIAAVNDALAELATIRRRVG